MNSNSKPFNQTDGKYLYGGEQYVAVRHNQGSACGAIAVLLRDRMEPGSFVTIADVIRPVGTPFMVGEQVRCGGCNAIITSVVHGGAG